MDKHSIYREFLVYVQGIGQHMGFNSAVLISAAIITALDTAPLLVLLDDNRVSHP